MLIMSWNLGNSQYTHRPESENTFWEQLAFIRDISPDIACLQEARWWTDDGHARLLAFEAATGLRAFLAPAQSGFHTIIAVRQSTVTPLAHTYDNRIEHAHNKLLIDAAMSESKPWVIVSTHLTETDGNSRLHETARLLDLAETPSIIAGTFNGIGPDDPPTNFGNTENAIRLRYTTRNAEDSPLVDDRRVVQLMLDAGFRDTSDVRADLTTPPPLTTGHQARRTVPPQRQDHIFSSPAVASRLLPASCTILDTEAIRGLSSHLPVVVHVRDQYGVSLPSLSGY
jgi:endonuclease/exonuclease/phosphatase family metal-dependent hydrolase